MTASVARSGIARRENGVPPPDVPLGEIDLGSLEFWELDDDLRDGAFATLRREAPITLLRGAEFAGFARGAGHWALTTFDDVHHASRHPEVFSSEPDEHSLTDVAPEVAEFAGSMISLDDPRHLRLRTDRQPGLHPEGGGPHRGAASATGPTALSTDMVANHPDGRADFVAEAVRVRCRCRSSAT